jgi:hypothetical protein
MAGSARDGDRFYLRHKRGRWNLDFAARDVGRGTNADRGDLPSLLRASGSMWFRRLGTELDFAGHPSVGTACALVMTQHEPDVNVYFMGSASMRSLKP